MSTYQIHRYVLFRIIYDRMSTINLTFDKPLQKFRSNAFAKPTNRQIRVKTEPGIPKRLNAKKASRKVNVVKVELIAPSQRNKATASQKEKQTLIDKIVALKSENQQLALQLRNEQSENAALKSGLQKMTKQMNTQSAEMNNLQSKLSEESAKYTKMNAQNEMKISNLMRAKDLLEARNKQLRKGVDEQAAAKKKDEDGDDDNIYEVEKLLKHKVKNGVRSYLVRWVGYSERYDTWEKESDLYCPDILNAYNASIVVKKM